MEFSVFQPTITKEYLFEKGINQESILSHYVGADVNSKKLFISPFRSDNHVTCSIYKSKSGILYIHDFATGEQINCFQAVMKLYNCNYYQALEIIAKDFGLIKGSHQKFNVIPYVPEIKETEAAKIEVQIKDFTDEELKWWEEYGITKKILKKYHVFSILHVFLNGNLRFTSTKNSPIYGYYFGKDKTSQQKWKLYFPMRESYRFLGNLTPKILQGYKQLPETGDLLVINKSMKDTMCCYRLGIPSVSPNSETTFPVPKQIEEFKKRFKHIIVMFDSDRPGLLNLIKIRHIYPELNYFFIPKSEGAKDLTDLVKLKGYDYVENRVRELLKTYKLK